MLGFVKRREAGAGLADDYWCGMGGGLLGVGVFQVIRNVRYLNNPAYREKVNTTNNDERNKFLANKAWAWAGYLYVLTAAIATIDTRGTESMSQIR